MLQLTITVCTHIAVRLDYSPFCVCVCRSRLLVWRSRVCSVWVLVSRNLTLSRCCRPPAPVLVLLPLMSHARFLHFSSSTSTAFFPAAVSSSLSITTGVTVAGVSVVFSCGCVCSVCFSHVGRYDGVLMLSERAAALVCPHQCWCFAAVICFEQCVGLSIVSSPRH